MIIVRLACSPQRLSLFYCLSKNQSLNFFKMKRLLFLFILLKAQPGFCQTGIIDPSDTEAFISTDKCSYKPGENIVFTLSGDIAANLRVRYKHLDHTIADVAVKQKTWQWKTPAKDYTGYLAELYTTKNKTEEKIATIGIDVSSDWKKFPRYGFVSKYEAMSQEEADLVVANLNRYHINGLQFYDWHYKHHRPLAGSVQNPDSLWKDIGGRKIHGATIRSYIKAAHDKKMKAMFYNLVYGTFKNAGQDGVSPEWYLYTDKQHQEVEKFDLAEPPFESDLFFTDPSNRNWQNYLSKENSKVYQVYDFDGYHMDQVGERNKDFFTYNGTQLDLGKTFEPFINSIKKREPKKLVVMNAVNQYGQQGIGRTGVEFMYTEVWPPNENFDGLSKTILENNAWSDHKKNTVLTAYVHFVEGDTIKGFYSTPAILLTDAVIFAFGGSHLELGEHLLGAPYFPEEKMQMKDDLKRSLLEYYDFLVAYQNLLRDGGYFNAPFLKSLDNQISLSNWPAKIGEVACVGKEMGKKQVIHLLNFKDASTLEWRDTKHMQKEPSEIYTLHLGLTTAKPVSKIWYASPDSNQSVPQAIPFKQTGEQVTFTLPALKYWDMLVVEYK